MDFWFDIWLKPINRKSTQYRDENMLESQLPMQSEMPRMTQIPNANVNLTSSIPNMSTPQWPSIGGVMKPSLPPIERKIEDTENKMQQLKSNKFNIPSIWWIPGITKPLIPEATSTQASMFPEEEKKKLIKSVTDVKGYYKKINKDAFEMLSERGQAKVKLDEKEHYLANQIRKEQNIGKEITDRMIIEDYKEQMGDDFFKEELNQLEQPGDLSEIDLAIIRGKFIPYPETRKWFEDESWWNKVKIGLSQYYKLGKDPSSVQRIPGKEIKNPLDAFPWLFRFAANVPASIRDVIAFAWNILVAPEATEEMLKMLPKGIAEIINQNYEASKEERWINNIKNTANQILTFINENPDIILVESPSKYAKGAKDFTIKWMRATINNMEDIAKITKEIPDSTIKNIKNLYKSFDDMIEGIASKEERIVPISSKTLLKADIEVTSDLSKSINKSIKPTVIEKKWSQVIKAFEKDVISSIDTILDNSKKIRYLDEIGETITKAAPETMREFGEAITQAKKIIYEDYASQAAKAWQKWALVQTQPIIDELIIMRDKLSKQIWQQKTVKYIDEVIEDISSKPTLDISIAQDNVQTFNNQLQAFYRNPNYNDAGKTVVDALVNNMLRNKLDDTIEKALNNKQYQALKQRYWALKNIEKEVNKRAVVAWRANKKGLIDFTDFVSADMAINWMIRIIWGDILGGVGSVGRWLALNKLKNIFKLWNSPDHELKNLIKKVQEAKKKWTLYSNKTKDVVDMNSMNPVSDVVNFENPKGLEKQGGLEIPSNLRKAEINSSYKLTNTPELNNIPSSSYSWIEDAHMTQRLDNMDYRAINDLLNTKWIRPDKPTMYYRWLENIDYLDVENITHRTRDMDRADMFNNWKWIIIRSKIDPKYVVFDTYHFNKQQFENIFKNMAEMLDEEWELKRMSKRKRYQTVEEEAGIITEHLDTIEISKDSWKTWSKLDIDSLKKWKETPKWLQTPANLNKSTLTNDLYNTDFDWVNPRFGNERNFWKISFDEGAWLVKWKLWKDFEVYWLIGEDIAGEAYNSKIGLAKKIDKSTPYHEITHAVKRNLDGKKRLELIEEVIKDKKITQAEVNVFNKKNKSSLTMYEYAEEAIADWFYNYLQGKPVWLGERIINWFKELFNTSEVKALYKKIDKWEFKDKFNKWWLDTNPANLVKDIYWPDASLIKQLPNKNIISKQTIIDLMNRGWISDYQRWIVIKALGETKETLGKIEKWAFIDNVMKQIEPLWIKKSKKFADYGADRVLEDVSWLDNRTKAILMEKYPFKSDTPIFFDEFRNAWGWVLGSLRDGLKKAWYITEAEELNKYLTKKVTIPSRTINLIDENTIGFEYSYWDLKLRLKNNKKSIILEEIPFSWPELIRDGLRNKGYWQIDEYYHEMFRLHKDKLWLKWDWSESQTRIYKTQKSGSEGQRKAMEKHFPEESIGSSNVKKFGGDTYYAHNRQTTKGDIKYITELQSDLFQHKELIPPELQPQKSIYYKKVVNQIINDSLDEWLKEVRFPFGKTVEQIEGNYTFAVQKFYDEDLAKSLSKEYPLKIVKGEKDFEWISINLEKEMTPEQLIKNKEVIKHIEFKSKQNLVYNYDTIVKRDINTIETSRRKLTERIKTLEKELIKKNKEDILNFKPWDKIDEFQNYKISDFLKDLEGQQRQNLTMINNFEKTFKDVNLSLDEINSLIRDFDKELRQVKSRHKDAFDYVKFVNDPENISFYQIQRQMVREADGSYKMLNEKGPLDYKELLVKMGEEQISFYKELETGLEKIIKLLRNNL